jgi:16S rRNA (cytosine967-C5)-methyltransferase
VSNAQAVHLENGWPPALDSVVQKADVVFVDAPCSGIGALRRNPEARWRLREADLAGFAAKQHEILTSAARLLAPGGRLVYGTCTLVAAENRDVVDAVVASRPELANVPLADVLGDRARMLGVDELSFTVAPDSHGTDGFYARVMRRV